jgi:hypothetical protein
VALLAVAPLAIVRPTATVDGSSTGAESAAELVADEVITIRRSEHGGSPPSVSTPTATISSVGTVDRLRITTAHGVGLASGPVGYLTAARLKLF